MSRLYSHLVRVPLLGWVVRWLVAAARLPGDRVRAATRRSDVDERIARLEAAIEDLRDSTQQLSELRIEPAVLASLSESVPVALRELRRELDEVKRSVADAERR